MKTWMAIVLLLVTCKGNCTEVHYAIWDYICNGHSKDTGEVYGIEINADFEVEKALGQKYSENQSCKISDTDILNAFKELVSKGAKSFTINLENFNKSEKVLSNWYRLKELMPLYKIGLYLKFDTLNYLPGDFFKNIGIVEFSEIKIKYLNTDFLLDHDYLTIHDLSLSNEHGKRKCAISLPKDCVRFSCNWKHIYLKSFNNFKTLEMLSIDLKQLHLIKQPLINLKELFLYDVDNERTHRIKTKSVNYKLFPNLTSLQISLNQTYFLGSNILSGVNRCKKVEHISIACYKIKPLKIHINSLSQCDHLKSLFFTGCLFNDHFMNTICKMDNLNSLALYGGELRLRRQTLHCLNGIPRIRMSRNTVIGQTLVDTTMIKTILPDSKFLD